MTTQARRTQRTPDFALSDVDLRAVTAFNVACAGRVLEVFQTAQPNDDRPQAALRAATHFAQGGARSRAQRITAPAAHRAAKAVEPSDAAAAHAAMAAGDAAASAYLHPLADATQVGHILRGPAHCVLALQGRPAQPLLHDDAVAAVLAHVTPAVLDVLLRYPRTSASRADVARVLHELDTRLRDETLT